MNFKRDFLFSYKWIIKSADIGGGGGLLVVWFSFPVWYLTPTWSVSSKTVNGIFLFLTFPVIRTLINHPLHSLDIISESWECLIKPVDEWSKYWPLRRLIVKFINIYRLSSTMMSTKIVCSYSPNKWEIFWITMFFQYAIADIKKCMQRIT